MKLLLKLILLGVLSLLKLTNSALTQSSYVPEDNNRESSKATRTEAKRGCPVKLGKLTLIGNEIVTAQNPPQLLFIAKPEQKETIIITVGHSGQPQPVYYKEMQVSSPQLIWIDDFPKLQKNQVYRITAGIRCTGYDYDKDKILQTSLRIVESSSEYDSQLEKYRENPDLVYLENKDD